MIKRNENRPGYKKTSIGLIPNEWNCEKLKKYIFLLSGQHIETTKVNIDGDGTPYLTGPTDFIEQKIQISKYTNDCKVICNKNDILLICKGSGTGKIALSDGSFCISRQIMAIRPLDINPYYLWFFLSKIQKNFEKKATGLIPGISRGDVLNISIPLPSKHEQSVIANIISNWNRAIEQIKHLIATKKQLKIGLMQRLLTGRYRFPKFGPPIKNKIELPKGWTKCKLRDCLKERNETNPDLRLLSITSDRGVIPRTDVERKDSSNLDKSKYKKITSGDIGYNTMRMWQGVSAVSTLEGIVSPAYTVCSPKNGMVSKYFGYLFKYSPIIHKFHRYSQGLVDDTLNLKFHNFSQIKVNIPNEDEQKNIAEILSAIDNEIGLLEKELSILVKQKNGMMQKLLTGEVRHPDFIKKRITKEEENE
jgi:type I restriction enzyme S subunit